MSAWQAIFLTSLHPMMTATACIQQEGWDLRGKIANIYIYIFCVAFYLFINDVTFCAAAVECSTTVKDVKESRYNRVDWEKWCRPKWGGHVLRIL